MNVLDWLAFGISFACLGGLIAILLLFVWHVTAPRKGKV